MDQDSNSPSADPRTPRLRSWADGLVSGLDIIMGTIIMIILMPILFLLRGFRGTASDPFSLRRYGDSLLTVQVKEDLSSFSLLLRCVAVFEWTAWWMVFSYSGLPRVLAFIIPIVFVYLVVMLDRAILTAPTSRGLKAAGMVFGRVAMILLLALVTSVPYELGVFSPEIDRVIESRRNLKVEAMRESARATERTEAEKRISESETALGKQPDSVSASRKAERAALESEVAGIQERLSREIGEGGLSGNGAGYGPAAEGIKVQLDATRADLAAFDKETERMRSAALDVGTKERSKHTDTLDKKLERIGEMTPDELVAQYGGDYEEADGFLARYRVMHEITSSDPVSDVVVWGTRLVMIIFGVAVLFMKFIGTSQETKAYYSLNAQALAGNKEALATLQAAAMNGDREALETLVFLGRVTKDPDPEAAVLVRELQRKSGPNPLLTALETKRVALIEANRQFSMTLMAFCAAAPCTRSDVIAEHERLRQELIAPAEAALTLVENDLLKSDVEAPPWGESRAVSPDPRLSAAAFRDALTDNALHERYGWTPLPTTTVEEAPTNPPPADATSVA